MTALALLAAPGMGQAAGESAAGGGPAPLDCSSCVGAECVKLRCLEKGANLTIAPCNRFDPACSGEGGYTDPNAPWGAPGGGSARPPGSPGGGDAPAPPLDGPAGDLASCSRKFSTGSERCMSLAEAARFASAVCQARGGAMTAPWTDDGRDLECSVGPRVCAGYGSTGEVFVCDGSQADAPIDPFGGSRPNALGGARPAPAGGGEDSITLYGASRDLREPARDETRRTRDYREGATGEDGSPEVRTRRTRDFRKQPGPQAPDWPTVE